ncbi:MAG: SDR family oxidoreductase [Armatimonadetes bacterium]|nr:SDR family oxidoreductase [Armatimonadota bacterium]
MANVLVTGGAGYLGAVLCGRLLERGHAVTVIDCMMYDQHSLFHFCSHDRFTFVRGDVRNEPLMQETIRSVDTVIPLAAIVGAPACDRDPLLARSVNLEAIRLLQRLRSPHLRVIYPTTNSGYGAKSGDVYCTEDTPLEPISLYGETKVQAEAELLTHVNTITLRLATVFGPSPRMRLDLLVNDFVYRAVTDGFLVIYEKDFKRNYIHIEDVADCFCFCLDNFDAMKGETYNVGLNEANLSKAELAEKIREQVPSLYVHYAEVGKDPDKRNYIVSNDKIKRQGFIARRTLEEGIRHLRTAYRMMSRGGFHNV